MPKILTLPGLPRALARDGWWLDTPHTGNAPPVGTGRTDGPPSRHLPPAVAVAALVLLADLLFWRHAPGLSVALFAAVILAVAILAVPCADIRPRSTLIRPGLLLALGTAPVIDHVQPLSLLLLGMALAAALVWARHPGAEAARLAASVPAFLRRLPGHWIDPLRPRRLRGLAADWRPGRWLRDWGFPVGGSLVIAGLLLHANPMLMRLLPVDPDLWELAGRGVFWLGTALLLAPLLHADLPLADAMPLTTPQRLPGFGINARSVVRALVPFNLLIGVQMVTDASILIAGAALPLGMDHAEYAHRGAYPLLATAVLAGAFALAARPFLAEHRLIRGLLVVWLAQNVVLCGAAALRLDLYIGAYGLTYMRTHALIWMALVALLLALIGIQIVAGRDTRWLVVRAGLLGLVTLYLCSFVNFAHVIAAQQLARDRPDMAYVCALGPMAAAAVKDGGGPACHPVPHIRDWRDWGFRRAQVIRRVHTAQATDRAPHEDPDR